MKYLRLAPVLYLLALCAAHAQRGGEPEPIPDFTNLDEFIYEPKTTLSIGIRSVGGAKTSFRGKGIIKSTEDIGNATDTNVTRRYHDGAVSADTRTTLIDNGDGTTSLVPITPDGKTASWNFSDDRQSAEAPGYIAMHNFSAEVVDPTTRFKQGAGSAGLELVISRDMGNLFHTRLLWNLTAGMTINDISAKSTNQVLANLTKITDLYSLYGETAPTAPYTTPSSVTTTVTDANGNPVLNPDGSSQTVTTDTTVLISSTPVNRDQKTTTDSTSVTTRGVLKGAYYTFRAGPTIALPIGQRFRATFTAGATLIYAGSTYTVTQTYQPEIGAEIVDTVTGDTTHLVPGYFADATMQFNLTSRTGFYAGAIFQQSGDYTQNITSPTSNYSTKIDFARQNGFRAGMTIKF